VQQTQLDAFDPHGNMLSHTAASPPRLPSLFGLRASGFGYVLRRSEDVPEARGPKPEAGSARSARCILRSTLDFRYIAIEGAIGVGKSRLADRLGSRLDATIVLDETDNPFLPDAQSARPGANFQAQLFFTLARHRQQMQLRQSDLFSQLTICDYLFERDKIYAYLNLDDNELFIYQRLYELLVPDLPVPDLVIYLQTPTDLLRRRLRERARADPESERLPDTYIRELNEAYNHFFFHYSATPLLVVETSQFDLSWGDEALADLERQLKTMTKGTRYYVPRK
jgi:deoxyadenosine/deoxycytidine kinase